jgi:NifU-like protein involved in Fe-S cluster formation/metal-sulfur cluster biosynthetic enzyme
MSKLPYSEKVLEHFRNPRNVGKIENPDGKAEEGSPACGDMVAVYIKVNKEKNTIEDIKFESYGCASNIATGSIITELAKGKTLEEAKKINWKMAADELGGLPPVKTHCAVLAVDGLHAAIENYEEKNGLIKNKEKTTQDIVIKKLKHVMNPMAGLDIVRTNIIKEIKIEEGIITIIVNLPSNHQFANTIKEDIVEKLQNLWDIKEVKVLFSD